MKVNPQTIRNWITRGEIRAVRVGARRVRILRTDLDSFLAATGATAPRDPSESEPAGRQETEQLAAALKTARAALAADRKTDLAIALHTLILAAEPVLSTPRHRSHQRPPRVA